MSALTDQLSKQYGPLPLGGWILAGAGGVAVAVMIRRRAVNAPAEAPPVQDTMGINGSEVDPLDNTNLGAGNLYQQGIYGPGGFESVEAPTTNAEWRQQAVSILAKNGYDGGDANRVLSKYINGETITGTDLQMVSAAIRLVGAPPDDLTPARGDDGTAAETPAPAAVPTPAPAPAPAPAKPAAPAYQNHDAKYVVSQTKASYFDSPNGRVIGTVEKGATVTTSVKKDIGGVRWVGTGGNRWFRESALRKA